MTTPLNDARTAAGLSTRDLALRLGVTHKAISCWEKHGVPPAHLPALSEALGVSERYLAGWRPSREELHQP